MECEVIPAWACSTEYNWILYYVHDVDNLPWLTSSTDWLCDEWTWESFSWPSKWIYWEKFTWNCVWWGDPVPCKARQWWCWDWVKQDNEGCDPEDTVDKIWWWSLWCK